ncbi:hypothetical protein OH77DRAFT_1425645 [Trametes cingulata]|nr:hypothetical protein OH77DRAFT_1425645 [Trametes cingulata]
MLARLSGGLPSAASLTRNSCTVLKISTQVRFNSYEAAAPAPASEPKRRVIPLADSLGGINIVNRPRTGGQRRDSTKRQSAGGNGGADRQQRPRQNSSQASGQRNGDRMNAGQQPQRNNNERNGQQTGQQNAQRVSQQAWPERNAFAPAQNAVQPQPQPQMQTQERPRRSAPLRPKAEEAEEEPVAMPVVRKIELGNLDDIFGPPVAHTSVRRTAQPTPAAGSPAQTRVQTLLERTAGDYSRYVPKILPTTHVSKLSPLEFGEFVVSKNRTVGLHSRQHALDVIQKFPATRSTSSGAQAQSP